VSAAAAPEGLRNEGRCGRSSPAVVTSAGGLATTVKKIFKSDATANHVLVRARTATNAK
jgi:hypothetical protein